MQHIASYGIVSDFQFTRRKSFSYVFNAAGEVMFRHRDLWPCIHWLFEEGIREYYIRPAGHPNLEPFAVMVRAAEDHTWQSSLAPFSPSEPGEASEKP
jgi:hypothetical protein